VLVLTFVLLGRSKSEQYFGFLPIFNYINFILGYIPLVCGDITSQIITIGYFIYIFLCNIIYRFINQVLYKNSVQTNNTSKHFLNKNYYNTNNILHTEFHKLFNNNQQRNLEYSKIPLVSKILSGLKNNITSTQYLNNVNFTFKKSHPVNNTLINSTVSMKNLNTYSPKTLSVSTSEAFYSFSSDSINTKNHNNTLYLNELSSILKTVHYPLTFNFNFKKNLNISYGQR
jgi:hypothetical protein